MPEERVASPLMLELEPVVSDTYSRHIDTAPPWYAHDYVPCDRGQNFKSLGGHEWDPSQVTLEEVFLIPDWVREAGGEPPPGWNGARWRRRSLAEIRQRRFELGHKSFRGISAHAQGVAIAGEHPWTPILLRVPNSLSF
ncbi:MAG: hypothetical protein ACLPLP_06965 [Mycobacterium sp.]